MSAYVVGKTHVDLLVRAALHYGALRGGGSKFRWWRVDAEGEYAGWRELVEHGLAYESDHLEYVTPSMAGQVLVSENVRSVAYRYGDCDADALNLIETGNLPGPCDAYYVGPYVYSDPGYVLTPGEVFDAIECLDYQSCETPDWRRSEAWTFLYALRCAAGKALPDYGSAPLGDWDQADIDKRKGVRA